MHNPFGSPGRRVVAATALVAALSLPTGCTVKGDDTGGAADDSDTPAQTAMDFVNERLVGSFAGDWQLYGLDATDTAVGSYAWTDEIAGTNPREVDGRAFVDITDAMDGGNWQQTVTFYEGVYVAEGGGVGDYFMEMDGVVTVVTEVEPNRWKYTADLTDSDVGLTENITMDNLVEGSKLAVKLVTWVDGWERHDVSVASHAVYLDDAGVEQTIDWTSLVGYHQRYE